MKNRNEVLLLPINHNITKLAPIEMEILVSRRSAHKIEMDSGTHADKNAKSFCSKKIIG